MTLQEILRAKGSHVHTIEAGATLADAVQRLVEHNCGSLVVVDRHPENVRPRMVGIVTERDVLRACARKVALERASVAETMTRDVIIGRLHHSVDEVMDLMTEKRIRHLPVLEDVELVGLVSIGDVVKARQRQTEFEIHYLKSYIQS